MNSEFDEIKSQLENTQSLGQKESFDQSFKHENDTKNKFSTTGFSQNSVSSIEQLKSENDFLKSRIKRIEETFTQKKGAVEVDMIIKSKFELEEELEKIK